MLGPLVVFLVGTVLIMAAFRLQATMREGADKPAFGFGVGNETAAFSNPIKNMGGKVRDRLDRRPLLPAADRPPLAATIPLQRAADRLEDYVGDGIKAMQVHLMQAARGTGWRVEP